MHRFYFVNVYAFCFVRAGSSPIMCFISVQVCSAFSLYALLVCIVCIWGVLFPLATCGLFGNESNQAKTSSVWSQRNSVPIIQQGDFLPIRNSYTKDVDEKHFYSSKNKKQNVRGNLQCKATWLQNKKGQQKQKKHKMSSI
jgi:hypothetical protein